MRVVITLSDTRRDVWRFRWHRTKWQLVSYEQQAKSGPRRWVTTDEWNPPRKNWGGVSLLCKPTRIPGVVENELREQARKAPIEL